MSLIQAIQSQVLAALWECCSPGYIGFVSDMPLLDDVARALAEDTTAFAAKDPASRGDPLRIVQSYTSYRAVLHYRLAHAMERLGQEARAGAADSSNFASLVSSRGKMLSGAEIHPCSVIGRRFVLDHGVGTVVGETSAIGDDCYVLGGVTLGASGIAGNPAGKRHPTIGHRVQLGAFSRVFGPVHVGDDVFVGPHCTITEDLPDGSRVVLRTSLQIVRSPRPELFLNP